MEKARSDGLRPASRQWDVFGSGHVAVSDVPAQPHCNSRYYESLGARIGLPRPVDYYTRCRIRVMCPAMLLVARYASAPCHALAGEGVIGIELNVGDDSTVLVPGEPALGRWELILPVGTVDDRCGSHPGAIGRLGVDIADGRGRREGSRTA